jgi:hypothetical protein
MEVCGQLYAPSVLNPGTRLEGFWVGPSAGLGFLEEWNNFCECLRWASLNKEQAVSVSERLECV